jgi:hypothetical protein
MTFVSPVLYPLYSSYRYAQKPWGTQLGKLEDGRKEGGSLT